MAGEQNQIFGNLPPRYRALPNMKAGVEDRLGEPPIVSGDYVDQMLSKSMEDELYVGDPMVDAPENVVDPHGYGLAVSQGLSGPHSPFQSQPQTSYSASYNHNFAPQTLPPAYQPPSLPLIPPHQIIAPGPAGWNPHGDAPMFTESPFTPQQMNSALQLWQTGQ